MIWVSPDAKYFSFAPEADETSGSSPAEGKRGRKSRGTEAAAAGERLFSARSACTNCGISYEPPSPQLFSFNSPLGMCPDCNGLGQRHDFVRELLIPNDKLSVAKGAIELLGRLSEVGRWRRHIYEGAARAIRTALQMGGITPDQVDYVNSHGTGTAKNDPAETKATRRGLGEAANKWRSAARNR